MAIVNWKQYNKTKAQKILSELNNLSKNEFFDRINNWSNYVKYSLSEEYVKIREEVIAEYNIIDSIRIYKNISRRASDSSNYKYFFDLRLGLALHKVLSKYGFTERQAGNIKIWNYLTVEVFLDYVVYRLDWNEIENVSIKSILPNRTVRTKLSTSWSYIHLSLQHDSNNVPDYELTNRILHKNSTDTILQLVDRVGSGYYKEFSRVLMKEFYIVYQDVGTIKVGKVVFFRTLMMLHLSFILEIDPRLMENGYEGYCKYLIEEAKKIYG